MTPEDKIKSAILTRAMEDGHLPQGEITEETIEDLYAALEEADMHWDYQSEMREGEMETDLPCPHSRHYESKSVAAKAADGSWVSWTYWYGGGKHGEPEAIDWMDSAYDLDCVEEEKLVVVRTFAKRDAA